MNRQLEGLAPPEGGLFGLGDLPDNAKTVVIEVPWEATTSFGRGTAAGPQAIRQASCQVDLCDRRLGNIASTGGIAWLGASEELRQRSRQASELALGCIAAFERGDSGWKESGDLRAVNAESAWLNECVAVQVGAWLDRGKDVVVLGGDHSVALGSMRAIGSRWDEFGVLQFDAHADLRVAYQGFVDSHASVMQRALGTVPSLCKLVSVGVRDFCQQEQALAEGSQGRIDVFYDEDLRRELQAGVAFARLAERIVAPLPKRVYISFDIDGLEPSLCPSTGTPVPGGLSFHQALGILDALVASGRTIVGCDLCEVGPGSWDANVGARLLYKLIGYQRSSAATTP